MRTPPRVTLALVVAATTVAMLGPGTMARASSGSPVNRAYLHKLQLEAARDAAMERRQHGRGTPSVHHAVGSPSIFSTTRDVEQISEDPLHQGERDTQVEPDIAMDPDNPDDVIAVVQQGRFKTG